MCVCCETEWIIIHRSVLLDFEPVMDLYHNHVLLNARHISMSHRVPCFTDHLFQISNWNDFFLSLIYFINVMLELTWSKLKKLSVYICVCTYKYEKWTLKCLWFYCRISMPPVQNEPIFPEHYRKRNQIHKSLLLLSCSNCSL